MKARDWDELERMAGIQRTVPRTFTQADAEHLTAKRLSKSKAWRRKLRSRPK